MFGYWRVDLNKMGFFFQFLPFWTKLFIEEVIDRLINNQNDNQLGIFLHHPETFLTNSLWSVRWRTDGFPAARFLVDLLQHFVINA